LSEPAFIAVNWGSSTFAAYLIDPAAGIVDQFRSASGITRLDRHGMATTLEAAAARWPMSRRVYCSGMIGSNVGWTEVPYLLCPAKLADVASALTATRIGGVECSSACEWRSRHSPR
jgi:2-dehydro-3-deoxygalactonokinase